MKPQKRFRFLIIALTATIFLSACKSSENNNSVSTAAKKIIQTIANCPNEEYYSTSDITAIGEGTDSSSESSETEPVDTYQNLKDTLGEYFTDTAFDAFYSQGIADKYFSDAFMNNYEISVQDIELVEKTQILSCSHTMITDLSLKSLLPIKQKPPGNLVKLRSLSPRAYASPIRKPLDNLASTACSARGHMPYAYLLTAALQPRVQSPLS